MFAKFGSPRGTIFGKGDHFWQFFVKIGPRGPILGGTDFGVTGLFATLMLLKRLLLFLYVERALWLVCVCACIFYINVSWRGLSKSCTAPVTKVTPVQVEEIAGTMSQ